MDDAVGAADRSTRPSRWRRRSGAAVAGLVTAAGGLLVVAVVSAPGVEHTQALATPASPGQPGGQPAVVLPPAINAGETLPAGAAPPPAAPRLPSPDVIVQSMPAVRPPVAATPVTVPVSTTLAAPIGTIPTYASPGGARVATIGLWYNYPLVLPVVAQTDGWLQVRLPGRPNGSTAWVQSSAVTLSSTDFSMVLDLGIKHLTVYQGGSPIMSFPAGIGVAATPTVTGQYFVAVHEAHTEPGYGPLILDTSAHSDAIRSWDGANDAIIAIHGPITAAADARIGAYGAAVSNGCIRLHDWDLAKLSIIPVGTPLDIVG